MSGIIDMIPEWEGRTIAIYVITILLATITAKIYSNKIKKGYSKAKWWLVLSFLVVWITIGFSTCGADYNAYNGIFLKSVDNSYLASSRIEWGYLLFSAVFRICTTNFYLFHAVWAFVFLILVYSTFAYFAYEIDVGLAVFAFTLIFCFQSMNLMRIYLAMAIIFFSMRYYLNEKYLKTLICIIVAFFFHRSAIGMLLPLIFAKLFPSKVKIGLKILVSIVAVAVIYIGRNYIFSGSFLSYEYKSVQFSGIGIATFLYHVPLVLLYIYAVKKISTEDEVNQKKRNHTLMVLRNYFILVLCSFVLGCTAYFIEMIGRMFVYFAGAFVLFPATVLSENVLKVRKGKLLLKRNIIIVVKWCVILFLCFRGFMMTEYFYTDAIMPYTGVLF